MSVKISQTRSKVQYISGRHFRSRMELINLVLMSDLLPILCRIAYCFAMLELLLCTKAAVGIHFAKSSSINDQKQAKDIEPNMPRDQLLNVHERDFIRKLLWIYCIIFMFILHCSPACLLAYLTVLRPSQNSTHIYVNEAAFMTTWKRLQKKLIKMFSNKHKKCYLGKSKLYVNYVNYGITEMYAGGFREHTNEIWKSMRRRFFSVCLHSDWKLRSKKKSSRESRWR